MTDSAPAPAPELGAPNPAPSSAAPAPVKRGRGRPRKDGSAPKSNKPKAKTVRESARVAAPQRVPVAQDSPREASALDAGTIARQLAGLHAVGAYVTRCPELKLEDDEAQAFAESLETVLREYNIPLSGKWVAMLGLLGTAAGIYVPRVILIRARLEQTRADAARTVSPPPRTAPEAGAPFLHEAARA